MALENQKQLVPSYLILNDQPFPPALFTTMPMHWPAQQQSADTPHLIEHVFWGQNNGQAFHMALDMGKGPQHSPDRLRTIGGVVELQRNMADIRSGLASCCINVATFTDYVNGKPTTGTEHINFVLYVGDQGLTLEHTFACVKNANKYESSYPVWTTKPEARGRRFKLQNKTHLRQVLGEILESRGLHPVHAGDLRFTSVAMHGNPPTADATNTTVTIFIGYNIIAPGAASSGVIVVPATFTCEETEADLYLNFEVEEEGVHIVPRPSADHRRVRRLALNPHTPEAGLYVLAFGLGREVYGGSKSGSAVFIVDMNALRKGVWSEQNVICAAGIDRATTKVPFMSQACTLAVDGMGRAFTISEQPEPVLLFFDICGGGAKAVFPNDRVIIGEQVVVENFVPSSLAQSADGGIFIVGCGKRPNATTVVTILIYVK